jgi:predicted DNA-binding transcriptional regulator YafY
MKRATSAERAMRRRLALLVLLHKRPHRYEEMIASLDTQNLLVYDRMGNALSIAQQQRYQFRHDIQALRLLDCKIMFDKKSQYYTWHNSPFCFPLEENQMGTFATLMDTFADSSLLHADDIRALLMFLLQRLSPERQKGVNQLRRSYRIDLQETTDYQNADPETVRKIELAVQRSRQIQLLYRSPRHEKEYIHTIEPHSLIFQDGHVYLQGWHIYKQNDMRFRLDYIIPGSVVILHTRSVPEHPPRPFYILSYQLSSRIARYSVSTHFPDQEVQNHPDGSATVTAKVANLFDARRILLSYGEHCTVLGPPELIKQMQVVARHYEIYLTMEE